MHSIADQHPQVEGRPGLGRVRENLAAWYLARVATIPLDEGPRRRRIGPFWIEEGFGLLVIGVVIVLMVVAAYTVAVLERPT